MKNESPIQPSAPLMPEDKDFAQQVIKYYTLPLKQLKKHIRSFRNASMDLFPEVWEVDITTFSTITPDIMGKKRVLENWLNILEDKVNKISITTSKGTVDVIDPYYIAWHFDYPIGKYKIELEKCLTSSVDDYKKWIIDGHIAILYYFLEKYTQLKKYQRLVVVGLFLVHFKIFREKPLMNKVEFRNSPIQGKSYRHYLIDRVKPILNTILKNRAIDFS